MADNVLRFEFLATDHFTPTADHVSEKLNGMGEKIGRVGKIAAFALGTVGVGALAAFGYEMVKGVQSAAEYQTLQLKTAAVIKSTGNVAHLSVAGIDELAHKLQETSGVEETLIINSENVLATFTNVRNSTGKNNDIYNQATARILDLSVAMGEDLQTATVQVGKALNDPVKGMTALQRVGVTFNATQKETIKHLVASGNVMGAQKIILGELNKEFGGAAKAAGSGFGGAMARVKNTLDDTFRDMAAGLLPVLTKAANWFADKLPGALNATGHALKVVGQFLLMIGKNFGLPILRLFVSYWGMLGKAFIAILPTIINLGKIIGNALVVGVTILVRRFREMLPTIISVAKVIGTILIVGVGILVHYFRDMLLPALRDAGVKVFPAIKSAVMTLGAAFRDHMDVIRAFGQVFLFVLKAVGVALAVLGVLLVKVVIPVIAELLVVVLSAVGPIVRALLAITGALVTVITGISSFIFKVAKVVAGIIVAILAPWVNANKFLFSAGVKIVTGLIAGWTSFNDIVSGTVSRFVTKFIIGPFAGAVKWLVTSGKDILVGLIRGYVGFWANVAKTVSQFIAKFIVAPFAGAVGWLLTFGKNILVGLMRGYVDFWGTVTRTVANFIARYLIGPFAGVLGWLRTSGRNILVGLIRGYVDFWGNVARTVASFINRYLLAPYAGAIRWLVSRGAQILTGLIGGIRSRFNAVTGIIGNVISRVKGAFNNSVKWLFNAGFNVLWGFWGGLKAIWDKVTGWISGIATWIRNHKGPVSLDAKLLIPAGRAIMQGFLNGLKSGAGAAWTFVKSVGGKTVAELQAILSGVGNALGAGGTIRVQGGGNSANRQMGQKMAAFYGWTGNQWAALNNLWMGESGWNNFARNPSSGAFGIPQALPPGKMGAAAAGGNAAAQIAWGLGYIKSVYGSPANAYAKWLARSPHWYDTGGYARGEGWFRKGPAPERILSPRQTKWFERAMMSASRTGGGHGSGGVTFIFNAPNYIGSRDELLRELNRMAKQGRLDAVVRLAN